MNKIPRRILKDAGTTTRQWKQHKRYQARQLDFAVDKFCFAGAFTPAKRLLARLRKTVREIRVSLKVKNWGN